MTEKQPSAEAIEAANLWWDQGRFLALRTRADWIGVRDSFAAALDAFAARSRREAITECADVCRSLGQYGGRNVQPAIEQIADQIAALNETED